MTTQRVRIVMYGTPWCGDCRRARRIFDEQGVAYDYIDIEQNEDGRSIVEQLNRGYQSVPTIIFPDGSVLTEPSSSVLLSKLRSIQDVQV